MAASIADNETWHVMIADDMKRMNVEQLDDAFRLSLVDASTMVWKAGMDTWQRLGLVAGLDEGLDEYGEESDDTITRLMVVSLPPPPPPRPLARPTPKPPSPRRLQALPPQPLVAPVYSPSVAVVAPVGLAPRDALPSEVNFRGERRAGVRWGRWLLAGALLTAAVLGAYRQNLLREGARRIGVEGKYLYGEQRVTAFIGANAPLSVQRALGKLALFPSPNPEPARVGAAPPPPALPPVQREATPPPGGTARSGGAGAGLTPRGGGPVCRAAGAERVPGRSGPGPGEHGCGHSGPAAPPTSLPECFPCPHQGEAEGAARGEDESRGEDEAQSRAEAQVGAEAQSARTRRGRQPAQGRDKKRHRRRRREVKPGAQRFLAT